MTKVIVNGIYKHFKGDLYIVEDIGYSSENEEKMVIFCSVGGLVGGGKCDGHYRA